MASAATAVIQKAKQSDGIRLAKESSFSDFRFITVVDKYDMNGDST